jgi:CDP-glycerol glycerophosphotransferase
MPVLSFVLVVHREQAYLEQCVASLLGEPVGDDVELVAIDDASPDHGPALLDALAERDGRVRVRHLGERAGRGEARNLALDAVAGDHVWFVETTDRLAPGALADIVVRLRERSPDVLLVHHERSDPVGHTSDGPHRRVLERVAEQGAVTLEQRPAVARAAPRAWDKVLRAEHLRGLGVRFGGGGHDELGVTWPALLAADRIEAEPGAAYVRREPGNAVRDRSTAGTPFDLFARYEAVYAFLDAHREIPAERRRLVAPELMRQALALIAQVPEPERRAFFGRLSETWLRHRRGDEPDPPGRVAALRTQLVERDNHRGFVLLETSLAQGRALRRRRVAAARAKANAVKRVHDVRLERHYRARRRQPVDPDLAVFAAYWYRGYTCNPRAIYERARELVPAMRGVWVVKPDAAGSMPPGVEHVAPGTREYYDVLARAGYFVNNVNFPNHLVKRPGTVHVMTHHGTPLKRMGLDLQDSLVAGSRMDFAALLRRCRRWDYSVSSNPLSTLVWERVYPTAYETLEVGYPRNDILVNTGADEVRRIRAELGIRDDQRAVLYAPTHREYRSRFVPLLDVATLADGLGPDHVVLARLHYFYGKDRSMRRLHETGRLIDVAAHPSVEELCLAADVLVTDYSSLMFDYAVLDRPIVIHAPDWDVYRTLRGTYFDLMAEAPGIVTTTEEELLEALRSGAAEDTEARAALAAFRERFCALDDGRAAERVVRRVWLGQEEIVERPVPSVVR